MSDLRSRRVLLTWVLAAAMLGSAFAGAAVVTLREVSHGWLLLAVVVLTVIGFWGAGMALVPKPVVAKPVVPKPEIPKPEIPKPVVPKPVDPIVGPVGTGSWYGLQVTGADYGLPAPGSAARVPVSTDSPATGVQDPIVGEQWWPSAPTPPASGHPTPVDPGQAYPAPARPRDVADRLAPLPQMVTGGSQMAQCPNCGSFMVDLRHEPQGFAFSCRDCDHDWQWQPGTAWPTTVVRPLRRRAAEHRSRTS